MEAVRQRRTTADEVTAGQARHRQVKARLALMGRSRKWLAAKAGMSERFLNYLVKGERQSPRGRARVAEALGLDYAKLWGAAPSPQPSPAGGEGDKE